VPETGGLRPRSPDQWVTWFDIYSVKGGGQIRINDQIISTIAGVLLTTTASTGTSINHAGQSQLIADGKLDVAATGQTGVTFWKSVTTSSLCTETRQT
jgi:hypothetical protein